MRKATRKTFRTRAPEPRPYSFLRSLARAYSMEAICFLESGLQWKIMCSKQTLVSTAVQNSFMPSSVSLVLEMLSCCRDMFLASPSASDTAACVLERLLPEMSSVSRLTFLARADPSDWQALAPKELSAQYLQAKRAHRNN